MSPTGDKQQIGDQPELKEKNPGADSVDRPVSPIVDRASALAHRITHQDLENRETRRLVDIARTLDREVMSQRRGGTGDSMGPLERQAKAQTLCEIYDVIEDRIKSAPLDKDGIPEVKGLEGLINRNSPNAGLLEDVPPFSGIVDWRAIAGQSQTSTETQEPAPRHQRVESPQVERGQSPTPPRLHVEPAARPDLDGAGWTHAHIPYERERREGTGAAERELARQEAAEIARSNLLRGFQQLDRETRPESTPANDLRVEGTIPHSRLSGYYETIASILIRPDIPEYFNDDLTTNFASGLPGSHFPAFREGEQRALDTWNSLSHTERASIRGGAEKEATRSALGELYTRASQFYRRDAF
jgi:hypothetical protein